MHRSGTSATTGALRLAGVALGSSLLGPGEDNPKGYWENSRAVAIHERLLASLDSSWDDIRPLPEGWERTTAAAEAVAQMHGLIDSEFSDAPLWAVKDPRMCRFLSLWQRVLAERGTRAVALLVARHPQEVAASIARRNGWSTDVGKLLWMRYVLESELFTRGMPRAVITYESLLADPPAALWRAAQRLGVELPARSDTSEQEFGEFVDSSERHHRYDADSGASKLDTSLFAAYAALEAVEDGREEWPAFVRAASSAERFLQPFSAYLMGLASMSRHWQSRSGEVEVERAAVRSDFLAQVRWSEEAVERERGLHAEIEVERSRAEMAGAQATLRQELVEKVGDLLERNGLAEAALQEERQRLEQERAQLGAERSSLGEERQHLAQERQHLGQEREALGARTSEAEARAAEVEATSRQKLEAADLRYGQLLDEHKLEQQRADLAEVEAARLRGEVAQQLEVSGRMAAENGELRARIQDLERMGTEMAISVQHLSDEIHAVREDAQDLARRNHDSEMELQAMRRSTSWRVTQPGRAAMIWLRKFF